MVILGLGSMVNPWRVNHTLNMVSSQMLTAAAIFVLLNPNSSKNHYVPRGAIQAYESNNYEFSVGIVQSHFPVSTFLRNQSVKNLLIPNKFAKWGAGPRFWGYGLGELPKQIFAQSWEFGPIISKLTKT